MEDKRLQKALEFAQDPAFIRWVKSGDEALGQNWQQLQDQDPTLQPAIDLARNLVLGLQVKEEPIEPSRLDVLWAKIDAQTLATPAETPVRRLFPWRMAAAAASVAILACAVLFNISKDYQTTVGEKEELSLPDGSNVVLNAASNLRYYPWRWYFSRKVELVGEGFFEVEKGRKFQVNTPLGKVEVLGTSFNVRARNKHFSVACLSGKVRVSTSKNACLLTPGQSTGAIDNARLSEPATVEVNESAAWREGRFYFRETSLSEVFEELQRQYDIRIQTSPAIARRVTTTYFETSNLDSALFKVCWPMRLESVRKGKVVLIR
jgi:transmembrane sensor